MTRSRKIILWATESFVIIAIIIGIIYAYLWWRDKKLTDPAFSKPIVEVDFLVGVKIQEDSFNIYRISYFEGLSAKSLLLTRKIEKK